MMRLTRISAKRPPIFSGSKYSCRRVNKLSSNLLIKMPPQDREYMRIVPSENLCARKNKYLWIKNCYPCTPRNYPIKIIIILLCREANHCGKACSKALSRSRPKWLLAERQEIRSLKCSSACPPLAELICLPVSVWVLCDLLADNPRGLLAICASGKAIVSPTGALNGV